MSKFIKVMLAVAFAGVLLSGNNGCLSTGFRVTEWGYYLTGLLDNAGILKG